jgi:hypothetical protein
MTEPAVQRFTQIVRLANGRTVPVPTVSKARPQQADDKRPAQIFTSPSASQIANAASRKSS